MKVLFVSSEITPLIKIGGLGDVTGSLPKALRSLGHDVRVLIPQYRKLQTTVVSPQRIVTDLNLSLSGFEHKFNLNLTHLDGIPVYLVDNSRYFGEVSVYTPYDLERFFFFSRAVIDVLPKLDWQPDIVHCHDWLTALVPMWQKKQNYPYSSVFTIHNLAHQGTFYNDFPFSQYIKTEICQSASTFPTVPASFMAQAIISSDIVTTVSETYAREILTPEFGEGLDPLIRYRKNDLFGIVNGIDYNFYNPLIDQHLTVNFDSNSPEKRYLNKISLQKLAGFKINIEIPLIAMVQRLDEQKGIDIFARAIDRILDENTVQFVILGSGREYYENLIKQITSRFPGKIASFIAFEEPLARLIYGGSDIFLMPSRFEPCGLGQIIAMRYGALPVVRHTGGLVDTVPDFNHDLTKGSGFVFHDYTPEALAASIKRAVQAYKDTNIWLKAISRVMNLDFSWNKSALLYENIYRQSFAKRR
jgi:starch synthase